MSSTMDFAHSKPAALQVNQLQFSQGQRGGATVPLGLSYNRFQKPLPIVIQKVDGKRSDGLQSQAESFPFTNVSSDSLTQAVQLAKRDLKLKRQEEAVQSLIPKDKPKTRSVRSKVAQRTRKQRPAVNQKAKSCESAAKIKKPFNSAVSSSRVNNVPPPAAPHSPPTRDSDPLKKIVSQEDKTIAEIHRLHQQIGNCIHQIQRLQDAAAVDVRMRQRGAKKYAEDIEEERKRQMRAEEQTTRSARNVYQLGQQVKELQNDINDMDIKQTKKSQVYNRLAATQRAAIRALQAFVQHMPDFDVAYKGMPASYAELGLLIEQLSLCCAQLGVAGLSGVPHSVLHRVETSFMSEVGQTSPRSPPRLCQVSKKPTSHSDTQPFIKESLPQKENRPARQKPTKKTQPKSKTQPKPMSPERKAALEAGVAALVHGASQKSRLSKRPSSPPRSPTVYFVPPLDIPKSPQSPRPRSVLHSTRPTSSKTGVLIPHARSGYSGSNTHFAHPTLSSQAKQVDPHEWPVIESPPVRRCRSPYQSQSAPTSPRMSPNRQSPRNLSPRHRSPRYPVPSRMDKKIIRDAWLEKQKRKDKSELKAMKIKEKTKLEQWKKKLGSEHKLLKNAEYEIRSKLQPILDKAEEISSKYALLHHMSDSFSSLDSETDDTASMNADVLSDMLVNELLNETVGEVEDVLSDEKAEEIACAMKQAPDVEALMQRLAEMECEQDEVRRRWATIVYEDSATGMPLLTKCTDDIKFGNPSSPAPIEIVPIRTDYKAGFSTLDSKPNLDMTSDNAIVFTKPKQAATKSTALTFSQSNGLVTAQREQASDGLSNTATRLCLSKESVLSIQKNKADFDTFLHKTTQAAQGKFKPWKLVEEIADRIFSDCVSDVALEIDAINNEIVDHVYGAEFSHVPEKTGLDSCL